MKSIKTILLNPLTSLLIGACLVGFGIDLHGKFGLIVPGLALILIGIAGGIIWMADHS